MNDIKITQVHGLIGLIVSMICMAEPLRIVYNTLPHWIITILFMIGWFNPVIIVYKDKKFSFRIGWDVV